MARFAPSRKNPQDSGWFLACIDERHDHKSKDSLSLISLYEAATHQPGIVQYIAFPENSEIFDACSGDQVSIAFNGEERPIQRGSYLQHMLEVRKK
jgi:hypothetical protein